MDGSYPSEGRLEVFRNGAWGTVSDNDFDDNDARVVCRSLGYGHDGDGVWQGCCSKYGQGTGPIHMDNVGCTGSEASIFNCSYDEPENKGHNEDHSIRCQGN